MAATRAVAKVNADWSKITSRLQPAEVTRLNRLKSQVEVNAIKVSSLPNSLPKIDWAHYKANASDPKIVEELEKKYNTVKVEVPKAPSARIQELKDAKQQDLERFKKFSEIAQSYVEASEVVKEKFLNMIPVKDMTKEDWTLTFPYWSVASIENPSIAPHFGRTPGLTREEAMAFEQPDPLPFANKAAWRDWEVRKKKFYS